MDVQTKVVDTPPQLLQLTAENQLRNVTSESLTLKDAVLRSEPALRYNDQVYPTQLEAHRVADDELVWSDDDVFVLGTGWTNETWDHYSISFQLIDALPDSFIVLNSAYNDSHGTDNTTVVAQAGVYQLSTGEEVSRSPLLAFTHLHHPDSNPSTWQFDDILLLRGDTVWYTLQLPSLQLVRRGPLCYGRRVGVFQQLAGGPGRLLCGAVVRRHIRSGRLPAIRQQRAGSRQAAQAR